jgi:hypothetical protein
LLDDFGSTEDFVEWVADGLASDYLDDEGVPRRPALATVLPDDSDGSIAGAHFTHRYNVSEIAEELGTSRARISRRLARLTPPARSRGQTPIAHGSGARDGSTPAHDRGLTPIVHATPQRRRRTL